MKEVFLEPEIEIVSFESLDQIGAGAGTGGEDMDSDLGGGEEWFWEP